MATTTKNRHNAFCSRYKSGYFLGNFVIKKQSENLTFTSLILELFFSAQGQRTAPILKGIKTSTVFWSARA